MEGTENGLLGEDEWIERVLKFYMSNEDILNRHSPRIVFAVICYLFTTYNQRECALKYRTTEVSIRRLLRELENERRIEKKERFSNRKTYYRVL